MNGKIVLGLATAVVTVGGALAFRANRGGPGKLSVGKTLAQHHCYKCRSLWSNAAGVCNTLCKTAAGLVPLHGINGIGSCTWYTRTVSSGSHCPTDTPVVRTMTTTTL
jgi:hypothetical protein